MFSSRVTGTLFTSQFRVWNCASQYLPREITRLFCHKKEPDVNNISENKQDPDINDIVDNKLNSDGDDLEEMRFKANLPDTVYRRYVKKEYIPPVNKWEFKKRNLRSQLGKYGEQSGLNPGIAWPTREELLDIIEQDKVFHPSLQEMLEKISAAEQLKLKEQLEYEGEVEKNLQKQEAYKKEYFAKLAKKKAEEESRKLKQRQLIEEISELLGYDVDPKDPKFQEAVEMKKKEEKKALKVKKQKESYEKMLAKLASIHKAETTTSQTQSTHSDKPQDPTSP